MILSEFSQAEKIIPCRRKIICNNCEQNSLLGDILNAGDNVDDQEDYGCTGFFSKFPPTVIYDYTNSKFLNTRLEYWGTERNIWNNDKQYDKRYQINIIDNKEYD